MARRVPVLVQRDTVPARYVADGITGVHLSAGDVAGTAATMASLLAHPDERRAMGNAGRARVARAFTETAMLDGFVRAADAARDRSRWRP
jgi:glycosyltransferase involved in cell wall biosynthesis